MSITSPSPSGRFHTPTLVREAGRLIKGSKGVWFRYFLTILGLSFVLTMLVNLSKLGTTPPVAPTLIGYAIAIFVTLAFTISMAVIGLNRAQGQKVEYRQLLAGFRFAPQLLLFSLSGYALFGIVNLLFGATAGYLISMIFGLFAYFSFLFIVDEQINAFAAIAKSFRFVKENLGMMILLYLWTAPASVLIGATLGIAGIWLFPFISILIALAYRDGNGIKSIAPAGS